MKNYLLLLALLTLSSCARKTSVSRSLIQSNSFKSTGDSSGSKITSLTDKTITLISRSIDTNIHVTGKPLSVYIYPLKYNSDTVLNFENDDLSLLLRIDKGGATNVIALPKAKIIAIKAFEQKAIYNNVTSNEETKTDASTSKEIKSTSAEKQFIEEDKGGSTWKVGLILGILLAVTFMLVVKKFSSLKIF